MEKLLEVKDLQVEVNNNVVINGLSLSVGYGEIVAIMGPNGSGKSSLANTIMGNPKYKVLGGRIIYNGEDIVNWKTEDRAKAGVFLSFQYPVAIPGVTVTQLLKTSYKSIKQEEPNPREFLNRMKKFSNELEFEERLLTRYVNDGFSGGEKKRFETLQFLVLEPKLLILDEVDSGLDIDGLQSVSAKINSYRNPQRAIIIITHHKRILDYVKPDKVYVIMKGRIVKEGDISLAEFIEMNGYDKIKQEELLTNGK
jgi:Fe-S cluster assembly ATP-binding protein